MTRTLKWAIALAVVAGLAGLAARSILARKAAQAVAAAPVAAPAVELAPTDLATATETELTRTLEVSGGLVAVRSALVKARIAAEILAITVREGETVRAGQLLVRLDDTEAAWRLRQAEDQVAAAQAQLDIAQRAWDNNRALVDQGFISRNALETSSSNRAAASASLQAARAAVELARKAVGDAVLRAPIDGAVSQRFMQPGERAGIDARLLEIVDLSQLELAAALAPEQAAALQVGQIASLVVEGRDELVRARVARINPSTQAGTRAVLAYLAIEAPPAPALRQGLFARGHIELQRQPALVVPMSALRIDQPEPYALVVRDGVVAQVGVTPGRRGEARFGGAAEAAVEVRSGLKPGDLVLRGTVGALRAGTAVKLPV